MSQSKRIQPRSEEHTSELQSRRDLVCRLLLEKKKPQARLDRYLVLIDGRLIARVHVLDPVCVDDEGVLYLRNAARARRDALVVFFFNDTATTEIYTLSLHDALPI